MGFFGKLFGFLGGGFVAQIDKAIDNNTTTKEEAMQLKNELHSIIAEEKAKTQEFINSMEDQLTNRHSADMQSDVWLAKNIRPLTLIFLTFSTIFYIIYGQIGSFADNEPKQAIFDAGLNALLTLDMLVYGFYFGSRGLEKVVDRFSKAMKK